MQTLHEKLIENQSVSLTLTIATGAPRHWISKVDVSYIFFDLHIKPISFFDKKNVNCDAKIIGKLAKIKESKLKGMYFM